MFINEVVHKVGLTNKSIRYYEENGLLSPIRNKNNSYRIYKEEDIEKLKRIKFLRELGVPIRDIKLLNEGKLTLKECMEERINKINEEEQNFIKAKNMCKDIISSNKNFNDIDITKHFEKINTLNKEGFTMRNLKTNKRKKIQGAVLSSFIFGIGFLLLIIIISYFQFTEDSNIPWAIYFILMFILCFPLFGIIYNLIARINEIKGGEEDEASKY